MWNKYSVILWTEEVFQYGVWCNRIRNTKPKVNKYAAEMEYIHLVKSGPDGFIGLNYLHLPRKMSLDTHHWPLLRFRSLLTLDARNVSCAQYLPTNFGAKSRSNVTLHLSGSCIPYNIIFETNNNNNIFWETGLKPPPR